MVKNVPNIETDRLYLRAMDETDAEDVIRWRSEPSVYRFFKSPHKISAEEHSSWFKTIYLKDIDRFEWICFERQSKRKIGVFGIRRSADSVEISYLLDVEFQHKGYAVETIEALIKFVKNELNIRRIIAEIHEYNKASIRLVEKMGFLATAYNSPFWIYELGE